MKKIYFAGTPWATSDEMLNNFIHQTPNNTGEWGGIIATRDKSDADFIIVMDETREEVPYEKVIFLGREPNHIGRKNWTHKSFGNFHHEDGNSWLAMTWWAKKPFLELMSTEYDKSKNLSMIDSGKSFTSHQNYRVSLCNHFMSKHPDMIDVYGNISNNRLPDRDKSKGLIDYRYHIAIENGRTDYYFSEKFCDPLLFLTMPFYVGCKKIDKFFPTHSYIILDETKPHDYTVDFISDILNSNYREEHIDELLEARDLVLYKYNIWSTIEQAIYHGKIL
mgnify:CR=1 FL=1